VNNSLDRLFEDIIRLLADDVIPQLEGDVVRSQVFSAIFMLKNIQMRVDWGKEPLAGQVRAQDELFGKLSRDGMTGGVELPAIPRVPSTQLSGTQLMTLRDQGNALVAELIAALPEAAAPQLVGYMRTELDMEMKHTAKPMFAEMSSGKKEAKT
jgi:hypothetical protein